MNNIIKNIAAFIFIFSMFSCQQDIHPDTDTNFVNTEVAIHPSLKEVIDRSGNIVQNSNITKILVVDQLSNDQASENILVAFVGQPLIYTISNSRSEDLAMLRKSYLDKVPVIVSIDSDDNMISKINTATNSEIYNYNETHQQVLPEQYLKEELNNEQLESRSNDVIPNLTTAKKIFDEVNKMCVVYANGTFAPPALNIPGYDLGRIPYQYAHDGCYARAHAIRRVVENNFGYNSYKRFIITPSIAQMPLTVKATKWSNPGCCIAWGYHVAVALKVRQSDGSLVWYVIDPSIFSEPVPAATWDNSMIGNPNTACRNMSAYNNQYKRYTIASQYYMPGNIVNNQQYFTADQNYTETYKTMQSYRTRKSCPK